MKLKTKHPQQGIALFIVAVSMLVLTLSMKEFFLLSHSEVKRIQNYGDRMQALYLARSTLNIARLFVLFDQRLDSQISKEEAADTLKDIWASPLPFPIPVAELAQMTEQATGTEKSQPPQDENVMQACEAFFEDFTGHAENKMSDLSALLNVNDLDETTGALFSIFNNLLTPNVEFLQKLNQRSINPEDVIRQLRDYMDRDEEENETRAPESTPYQEEGLTYTPKNRPFTTLEEIKLIPSMDEELFDYLTLHVSSVYFANRLKPAKINLNTVSKNVFQALLNDVPNPEEMAENFIQDRKENNRTYTNKNVGETLKEALDLSPDKIKLFLCGGTSEAFKAETQATVNNMTLKLDAIILKPQNTTQKMVVQIRTSP